MILLAGREQRGYFQSPGSQKADIIWEEETLVTIEYECETDFDLGLDCPALAKLVAEKVLDMENCPWDAQVNLVLTDNEEIKRVNTEFRGIERATDVLSFPMLPFETPADYSVAEDDESCFDLDSGELLLGDIMISAERAAAQAEEYGHSVKREFCFLVAHSMLHLLGYDHMGGRNLGNNRI